MSYGADFATADPAGAPLDPAIMIGADPVFWGAALLALLVAALIGWLMGSGSRAKRADAAGAIWEAVDDAAKTAMQADTEALPARASDLHRVLRARLGRTLDFGGELTGCVKALDAALKGEVEDRTAKTASPQAAANATREPDPEAAATSSAAASVTIVSVHQPPAAPPPPSGKPGKRPMTTQERNDALRLAVAAFNDYWRHRPAREADMRAVVAELSDPGPRRPPPGHTAHH